MRVTDLIEQLLKMPQEAEVRTLASDDDTATIFTLKVDYVYVSNSNDVIITHKYKSAYFIESIDQPNPIQP